MAKDKGAKVKKPHLVRKSIGLVLALALLVAALAVKGILGSPIGALADKMIGSANMSVDATVVEATTAEARATANQVEQEGAVLLRNEGGVLPLGAETTKVNVFGWASTEWLGGGSGSGGVSSVDVDLLAGLEAAGIEYNAELTDMYTAFQADREFTRTLNSWPEQSCRLYEPAIDDAEYYTPEMLANAESFSDTAIVVLQRFMGESNDATKEQYKVVKAAGEEETATDRAVVVDDSRDYLELSTEEEALLAYVGEHFDKVVVLVNSANAMELGQLETIPGIDACLLVGYTGQFSAEAVPGILWGEVNPSGKTVDTFAYDLASAPNYAVMGRDGIGSYTNSAGLYPANGITNGNLGEDGVLYDSAKYSDYAEGIYVGYRYYETAAAEGFIDYDATVQYPFGYGLSYTSFEWEVVGEPAAIFSADDTIEVEVKVTNTGSVAGKDVVELYFSAPYTAGGIEKSAVELGAFAKTKLLEPGESETLTLTLAARDMASYDCYDANGNGFAGYELENGTYQISLRTDAHTVVASFDTTLAAGAQLDTDAATGATVSNKFTGEDAVDGVALDGSTDGQDITYLSRADFAGTWPVAVPERDMSDAMIALNLPSATAVDGEGWGEGASDVTTGANNGLAVMENGEPTELGLALGRDYDDPQWDALLDQLTQDEMEALLGSAYSGLSSLPSVGKPITRDLDGPAQFGGFVAQMGLGTPSVGMPCPVVLAQTWNAELAHAYGKLIAEQTAQMGYDGWYAPATNLHRSPLDGRNYEYYSEDPLISGTMCGEEVAGAKEAGIYVYVKHFICNDAEAYIYRDSVYSWMTEQTLRELYLEPFRMLVEDYGATGLMSSYNRIGAVWSGGSKALLTGVLRDEWGFTGMVITDFSDHPEFMNGAEALKAGGNLWMVMMGDTAFDQSGSADYLATLREATKQVLWSWLNVRAANVDYVEATGDAQALRPVITGISNPLRLAATALQVLGIALSALAIWRLSVDVRIKRELKAQQQ